MEYRRWKATEFRLFLLYVGPVVLKGEIAEQVYQNFMLLSVSIRIFVDPLLCLKHCDFVKSLLLASVDHFEKLFGSSNLVYNVHALIHLVNFIYLFFFYLYIYPPDSQESDGGAIHRVSNYPDLLPEMPRYCCPLVI